MEFAFLFVFVSCTLGSFSVEGEKKGKEKKRGSCGRKLPHSPHTCVLNFLSFFLFFKPLKDEVVCYPRFLSDSRARKLSGLR